MSTAIVFLSLGSAVALLFRDLAAHGGRMGSDGHLTRLALAAVVYAVTMALLQRRRYPSRAVLLTCLALAVAARIPLIVAPTGRAHDTYRYVWDARLQRAGFNPYTVRPDDPAFDRLQSADTRMMNNRDVPSPYPPGAQYFFRAATSIGESSTVIRASLVAVEALTVWALWLWLIRRGRHPAWTLIYAWHPVVIFETASGGHVDALGVMLLVVAMTGVAYGVPLVGVLGAAASASTKFLPLVLAPLRPRGVRWWHVATGALCLGLLYLPFADGWQLPVGSLGDVVDRFRFNQLAFDPVARWIGSRATAGIAVAAGLVTALALRRRADQASAWAWPMAVSLLLAPVVYPWYLVWLVPFAVERASLPLLAWSLAVIPTYRVWALDAGQAWAVPESILVLEYGTLAAVSVGLLVSLCYERRGQAERRSPPRAVPPT